MKNSNRMFIFFYVYHKMVKDFHLSDEERLQYYDLIINYGLYGRKPNRKTTPQVRHIFELVKQNILQANKNYEVALKQKW